MNYEDLPNRWKGILKSFLKSKNREVLMAEDFPQSSCIDILFKDGSLMAFFNAIFIGAEIETGEGETVKEYGIFTEHCGYFIVDAAGVEKTGVN